MTSDEPPAIPIADNGPTLRTFPLYLPERRLDTTTDEAIPELVKRTWSENIVKSESMQLSIPPEYGRDLVFYGATDLAKEARDLTNVDTFRTCVRWLLVYQRTWLNAKNDTDLALLAKSWNELLHHGPQVGEQRHWFLDHATNSYQQFYEASRTDNNFNNARSLGRIMLSCASTPRQSIQSNKRMGRLFGVRIDRFQPDHKDWRPIVNTSIHYLNLAIKELLEHPELEPVTSDKDLWEYCAWALEKRYDVAYQDADILQAISYYEVLLEKDKKNLKEVLLWRDKLARAYWRRFRNLKIVDDGKRGIAEFEKILDIESENPHAMTGLAELLRQTAKVEVLSNVERRKITNRSIELLERCIADTPEDHPNLANRLGKLTEALIERYEYDADTEDIDMAIALQMTAIELPGMGTAALAFHHKQLSEKYILKFQATKDREDIEMAMGHIQKCLEMTPKNDDEAYIGVKLSQATAYGAWYLKHHAIEHLQLGISTAQEALEICRRSGWRPTAALEILAKLYEERFKRLQNYDDASKGIQSIREVIDAYRNVAGKNATQHEAASLSILAKLMRARAEAYAGEEDWNEAVRAERDALNHTDLEHPSYTTRAVDLSYNLTSRFRALGKVTDLEEAANILDVALQSIKVRKVPATGRELGLLENQYGIVCRCRGDIDSQFVKEAMAHFEAAIVADPSGLPYSRNYAVTIADLARESHKLEDALTAVKAFQTYVLNIQRYAPETADTNLPDVLYGLAILCVERTYAKGGENLFMAIAIKLLDQLCEAKMAPVKAKIYGAYERSKLAAWREKDFKTASKYVALAASLLPEFLNPGLSRVDQLRLTQSHAELPSYVLTFNIMAENNISQTLQLFERARGVLWNRLLNETDKLESLDGVEDELAKQFRELHSRLSAPRKPIASLENDKSMSYGMADSYADALKYNNLLKEIRIQPGLEDFLLLPSQLDEIRSYAGNGSIVVVNSAQAYAHAIIITGAHTVVLPLPAYSYDMARQLYNTFKSSLEVLKEGHEKDATKMFNGACMILWYTVAQPVLDKLDELSGHNSAQPSEKAPIHRVWWLTNQWINVLPIHAAGDYSKKACTVLDRSISSYISSFGSLKYARKNKAAKTLLIHPAAPTEHPPAVIVSISFVPGQAELAHAAQESSIVTSTLAEYDIRSTTLSNESATKKSITSSLKTATLAHFICHGLVDSKDPLKSQLLHHDSHRNSLDVKTLIRTNMPSCALVYLSVCSAAASDTLPLVDEGLHLAGAFLMAGVPHVIATRWELADQLAVGVAEKFYARLGSLDADAMSSDAVEGDQEIVMTKRLCVDRSAEALRDVLLTVRNDGVPPILYGSYVHYGV